jgi:hypothetical protein
MQIIENHNLMKPVVLRWCRSKKRRIRKKWAKNPNNTVFIPDDGVYIAGDIRNMMLVCHPVIAAKLREAMR